MSTLTSFKLLSFDVYGTLIDWETGIWLALQPLLQCTPSTSSLTKEQVLHAFHDLENVKTPGALYSEVLASVHPRLAEKLGCAGPTPEQSRQFGESVGMWPAFPDTVDALQRLSKFYKLVPLSNVDNKSIAQTNAQALAAVTFDAVLTAEDIGTWKPDRRNFEYLFEQVEERFGIQKRDILHTAVSQFHDHHPMHKFFPEQKTAWIVRPGAIMEVEGEKKWDWKFDTMGEMAEAVEREAAGGKV
ncbi:HAD-like protein [Amniculicola lignicola CBS 123094]|uniref:HAD-like protein n=1 Tax=Amniculicola lignicola CBS 123094 TaxID=1392246 RepID=A0A6A5WL95_9PLEO|nr:HAD-like protein [Amniculicola lignicola CBS 123094]